MLAMQSPRFQFSIKRILTAIAWIALALAIWRLASPFDWHHFADDDPDNIRPRMLAAFYLVPLAGAAGSLVGRPIACAARGLVAWLAISAIIIAIGMARVF
jgi:hypothetical protein